MKTNSRPFQILLRAVKMLTKASLLFIFTLSAYQCSREDEPSIQQKNQLKSALNSENEYTVYFQNELFVRETGKPIIVKRLIGNSTIRNYEDCFKLHVQSGVNGEDFVSSATVKVDGTTYLNTSNFNNSNQSFTFNICNLTETSVMEVEIFGTPGSTLEIWIEGRLKNNLKVDLIGYWTMDETSGLIVYDVHGNNNLQVNENVYLNQVGLIGRADSFDNSWSGLSSDKTASVLGLSGGHSISVSVWIKPDISINGLNSCGIIHLGTGANQEQFGIKYWADPAFWMFDSWYGSVRIGANDDKLADGVWHHIVVTYNSDGHRVRTYLDGAFVTEDASKTLNITDGWGFHIGVGSQGPYIGLIDEVGLWSRPLSDSEVQLLYNDGVGLQYPF